MARPIKQLIPIEVTSSERRSSDFLVGPTVNISNSVDIADQSTHPTQFLRAAAVLGEATQRNWTGILTCVCSPCDETGGVCGNFTGILWNIAIHY